VSREDLLIDHVKREKKADEKEETTQALGGLCKVAVV
jgi:hypothetical protein